MRVAVIGMGTMGRTHVARYLRLPDVELVAVADAIPERLKAEHIVPGNLAEANELFDLDRVELYDDGRALLANVDVDLIDICLPAFMHAEFAIAALNLGRHVLCEKPMAMTSTEADQMIAAAEANNRLLMIAQCIRFWPEYRVLLDYVRNETFGKLLSLQMVRMGGKPSWSWEDWFLDPVRSGGPILDLQLHDIDFVNHMLGLPAGIQASGRVSPVTNSPDVTHTLLNYRDGPQVHIWGGWNMAQIPFQARFEAWFERGFVRYDGRADPRLQVFDNLDKAKVRPADYEPGDAYYNEIGYLVDCIRQGKQPELCMPQSTRDSIWLIEKQRQAMDSGETIWLD